MTFIDKLKKLLNKEVIAPNTDKRSNNIKNISKIFLEISKSFKYRYEFLDLSFNLNNPYHVIITQPEDYEYKLNIQLDFLTKKDKYRIQVKFFFPQSKLIAVKIFKIKDNLFNEKEVSRLISTIIEFLDCEMLKLINKPTLGTTQN